MINWGILGLGRMGLTFAGALKETSNSKLIGIGSKTGKTFENFTNKSYDEIINDKNIEAIYISTLNNTHIELIKKIINSKKKILCEKPVSISLEDLSEVQKLIEKNKIQFYEAIAYYCHPQTIQLLKMINNDEIGEIKNIESNFGFKARLNPQSRLFNKSLGGGCIFDLACYPLSFFMLFTQNPKKIVFKSKKIDYAKNGIDEDAKAILNYENRIEGKIHVSFKSDLENSCTIHGSKGFIKINNPWLPEKDTTIEISSNKHFYIKTVNSKFSVYANQIESVSKCFLDLSKKLNLFDIEKSLINMKLMSNWLDGKST